MFHNSLYYDSILEIFEKWNENPTFIRILLPNKNYIWCKRYLQTLMFLLLGFDSAIDIHTLICTWGHVLDSAEELR